MVNLYPNFNTWFLNRAKGGNFFLYTCTLAWLSLVISDPVFLMLSGYAIVDEKRLYIHGGFNGINANSPYNIFYSLELTSSWERSNPPWESLNPPKGIQDAPSEAGETNTLTPDEKFLVVWGPKIGIYTFEFSSGKWTFVSPNPAFVSLSSVTHRGRLMTVADPGTGIIYVPGGSPGTGTGMLAYNLSSNTTQILSMPTEVGVYPLADYAAVWSTERKSLILSGGGFTINAGSNLNLFEYVPQLNQWKQLNTTGPWPGILYSHCMVSAHNGSNIIVFGGSDSFGNVYGSIYILDVKNLSWTKGPDVDPPQYRAYPACSVAGDNFLAWGGYSFADKSSIKPLLIYDLKRGNWTDQFTISSSNPVNSSSSPNSDDPVSSSHTGAIAGGIAGGGVTILFIIAGFIFYRRRRRTSIDQSIHQPSIQLEHIPKLQSPRSPQFATMEIEQDNKDDKEERIVSEDENKRNPQGEINSFGFVPDPPRSPIFDPSRIYIDLRRINSDGSDRISDNTHNNTRKSLAGDYNS